MKQETALSMLWGALAAAGAYGLYLGGRKATKMTADLCTGLSAVGKMAETNQLLVDSSQQVALELQLLRGMMSGAVTQGEQGPTQDPNEGAAPAPKPSPVPYPVAPMSMYEATEDETTVDDTDDATAAAYEKLEEVRLQGFEADPEELQDGVLRQV